LQAHGRWLRADQLHGAPVRRWEGSRLKFYLDIPPSQTRYKAVNPISAKKDKGNCAEETQDQALSAKVIACFR
jgi:hypothetical protein